MNMNMCLSAVLSMLEKRLEPFEFLEHSRSGDNHRRRRCTEIRLLDRGDDRVHQSTVGRNALVFDEEVDLIQIEIFETFHVRVHLDEDARFQIVAKIFIELSWSRLSMVA